MQKLWPFLFAFLITLAGQAQPAGTGNNTFLWRISKPGITRPSFVFGTMHVTDSRAFNFKDSLYYYLEQSDAFAMEVHPDSFSTLLQGAREEPDENLTTRKTTGYAEQLDKLEQSLDKKTVARIREKFREDLGDKKMSNRELTDFLMDRIVAGKKKRKQEESMATFMDAFLYNMAEQQGKKILGLESATQQMGLLGKISSGIRLENIGKLIDTWDLSEESPVHSLYYREKFDSFDAVYTLLFTDEMLDEFLYRRNRVMVSGIDSVVSSGQVLFTAVGAAHLPGEKGVLNLLQKKGYRVEPVFSDIRIPAATYTKGKLRKRTWTVYENRQHGFRYELPGVITEQDKAKGERVAYYYDIGSGFIYTIRYGRLSVAEQKKKTDWLINAHLLRHCMETGGVPGTKSAITKSGLTGKEVQISQGKNYFTRYREFTDSNMFYILTVTAGQKEILNDPEPEQFFASFQTVPVPASTGTAFKRDAEGFRVQLPGPPREEPAKTDSASKVQVNSYSFFEKKTGINYTVMFARTIHGNEYIRTSPDYYFSDYLDELKEQFPGKKIQLQDTLLQGFPGKLFITPYADNNQTKGLLIRRHNISYYILAEYDTSAGTINRVDQYLSSFSLLPLTPATWKTESSVAGGFRAWLPAKPDTLASDNTAGASWQQGKGYYAQDPHSSLLFKISIHSLGPYFWAAHEDSVYHFIRDEEISAWSDSLISFRPVSLGKQTGREMVLRNKQDGSQTVIRYLLNGNGYYRLSAPVMPAFDDAANRERFLSSFELINPESSEALYKRNAEKLFTDLQSPDSALHHDAFIALDHVKFTDSDIPLLLEKIRLFYPEAENEYYDVYDKLTDNTEALLKQKNDPEAWNKMMWFSAVHYADTGRVAEQNRFRWLGLLAAAKTKPAYEQLLTLMQQRLPAKGNEFRFYNRLQDSLTLASGLFPRLLKYAADSINGLPIISLANTLLDSNLLSREQIIIHAPELIRQAKAQLKKLLREPADSYDWDSRVNDLLVLLEKLSLPETPGLLQDYVKVKIIYIAKQAALSLLALGKKVPASLLEKVAADKTYRVELYRDLEKINKLNLFPAAYRDQYKMAEAYLVLALTADDYEEEDFSISFIKKKEQKTGGLKGVYYLFRVDFDKEEESGEATESYLGIAGPFAEDPSIPLIPEENEISGMYTDEEFDGYIADKQFSNYIRQWLEWKKKN